MKFNERLKKLRTDVKETQKALAQAIGVSTYQIIRFEKGEQKPGFDNLIRLADCFQVSLDYLVGRSQSRPVLP